MNFGLFHEEEQTLTQRIEQYRQFVYEVGSLPTDKGNSIDQSLIKTEQKKGYRINRKDRFKQRTRYFTDSGVIGSKAFVAHQYQRFEDFFESKHPKRPIPIEVLDDCFSLKRLASKGY